MESILIAVLAALIVRTFFLSGFRVSSPTMSPLLRPGDFVLALRVPYGVRVPLTPLKIGVGHSSRGEVVVFSLPEQPQTFLVRRVVGIAGDLVQMRQGRLWINEKSLNYIEPTSDGNPGLRDSELRGLSVLEEKSPEGSRWVVVPKVGEGRDFGPLVVPQGEVLVLSDRRDFPTGDFPQWISLSAERIDGRVIAIWMSLDWNSPSRKSWPTVRLDRVGQWVD